MATAPKLNSTLRAFIERQHLFFVATAGRDGRVNLSPKGLDTLKIMADDRIVWLNLSGSGNETAAHVRELPRMTMMFCAFEGDPMILRVYGTAKLVYPRHAEWDELAAGLPELAGSRQIFDLAIDLVQTSCGTGVPVMPFSHGRGETELVPFYAEMDDEAQRDYWQRKNVTSIDGKPTGIFGDDS